MYAEIQEQIKRVQKIYTATSFDRMSFYPNFVFFTDNVYINNKKKRKQKVKMSLKCI